jgi:hypothetical protein
MTKTDKIMKNGFQRSQLCQAPVAYACNPSYSGGRDQEHLGLMGKQFSRPYLENAHHKKRAGGVAHGEGPEFKPQYRKTNK